MAFDPFNKMSCPLSCYCGLMCSCALSPRPDNVMPAPPSPRREHSNKTVYILLLGAAETGKSTIMRQMKIIHNGGMSPSSRRSYTRHVLENVFKCVRMLIHAVSTAAVPWGSPEAAHAAHVLGDIQTSDWGLGEEDLKPVGLPPDHTYLIQVLWADTAAQECWHRANEFNLPDNTAYFLNAIERLGEQPYVPAQDDVLQLRMPTRSVAEFDFRDRNWTFRITDVGGQRGERQRWLRLFNNINAVIFLAALSEYDQTWSQEEEEGMNRLELSIQLFRETLNYPGFAETCIILFLNKTDVLQKKIVTSDLKKYFPKYNGPRGDAQSATEFIRSKFSSIANDRNDFFTHETCATDTLATRFVFAAVRESILYDNLRKLSLSI